MMPKRNIFDEVLTRIAASGIFDSSKYEEFARLVRCDPNLAGIATAETLLKKLQEDDWLTPLEATALQQDHPATLRYGDYRLVELIGTGASSNVYLAIHVDTHEFMALKVLKLDGEKVHIHRENLIREAQLAETISHPNILKIDRLELDAHPPYLVMEYIDGLSLQAAVSEAGTMSAELVAHVGRQVALGLNGADDLGLVHRDIKPANLMLDRNAKVTILDLGLAHAQFRQTSSKPGDIPTIMGTVEYFAPEQAVNSDVVDIRADIYALGGTLYFLLTGQPPFNNLSRGETIRIKRLQRPTSVMLFRPDIPRELVQVIERMLAPNPKERFQTPIEVYAALESLVQTDRPNVDALFEKCTQPMDESRNSIFQLSHNSSNDSTLIRGQYNVAPRTQRMRPPIYGGEPTSVQMPAPQYRSSWNWQIVGIVALLGIAIAVWAIARLIMQ